MKNTDYEIIFRHRGQSYHKAMSDFPGVRKREFENLFSKIPLREGETIIDCPALGGYLGDNIDTRVKVESIDFCPQSSQVKLLKEFKLREKVDRVVCLASSHHINHLGEFISHLSPFIRRGGYLHLADVNYDSSIRFFLDDFVGQWTSTGHKGTWRDLHKVYESVEGTLKFLGAEDRECPWKFQTLDQIITFCRLLFGLNLNPSDEQVTEALEKYVGISRNGNEWIVRWKLTYADFVKYD